jgi:rubredoxin/uncharacterized membrane protein
MKKWQCSICGYIHEGDQPPETCPVCGADQSKFIELDLDEPNQTETKESRPEAKQADLKSDDPKPGVKQNRMFDLMVKHHVHPISVHIPNGLLPVSVIFIFLAAIFKFAALSQAAFYNMVFVIFAMPLVLFSGFLEWQKKYNGAMTKLFLTKMICGAVVSLSAIVLSVWLFLEPQILASGSSQKLPFLFINLIMLSAATVAGLLGGKLVFKD